MADRSRKNLLEYLLFLALLGVVRILPRNLALSLGSGLGWLSQYLLPKRRRTAAENLRQAFPNMTARELDDTLHRIFRHLGKSGVEMILLDRFRTEEDLRRYFSVHGEEHLRAAQATGKGFFIVTAHIGFWEVGTFCLPMLGCPVSLVAKKMKNPLVGDFFQKVREAGGSQIIDSKRGARRIVKALAEGRAVATLLDQHITPREAVQVDFFGRPAWTTPIIAQIAMKQGIPVLPAFSYRTPENRYEIYFEEPIHFAAEDDPKAVIRNTQLLTDRIEAAVRRDPTQWFWVHRRWR